ncbi:MAG TPA: TonB-dependent receptor [Chthoniobacterales bacterium]
MSSVISLPLARLRLCVRLSLASILISPGLFAQEAVRQDLDTLVVESEAAPFVQEPFMPDVSGVKVYAGKKTSVIDLDAFPKITNNNYRQALAKTPGLLLSEETTPLVSIGYRGLDPHRAQFTQVLKDGIPIHADQFGYPEAYYTPPLDTVDRIEFLRGGASLIYGPQPGGALNFVTHRPRTDKALDFGTSHTFGSDNYYSTFTHLDGTSGRLGYYGYYNHREGDGFRTANSQFQLDAGQIKLVLDANTASRWILTLETYQEEHGEPGGLSLATGPGVANYNEDRTQATRLFDLFELTRHSASLQWELDISPGTRLLTSGWATYYRRYSQRQRGGGFGTAPTGPDASTNSIEEQEFYTLGFETRLRHDYEWLGGSHTFTGGVQFYHTQSPRQDSRGSTPDATSGVLRTDTDREVTYLPLFLENQFTWGAFSITPGVRFENIWQGVKENLNVSKTSAGVALADQEDHEFVALFGLGTSYKFTERVEIYGNVSESYRPKVYTQAVPTDGTALVPNDLNESHAWSYELGLRGRPTPWTSWDVSGFYMDFEDQIGRISLPGGFTTVANVGRAEHYGVEIAGEIDFIGMLDSFRETPPAPTGKDAEKNPVAAPVSLADRFGSLSLYGNATLLHAEFVSGPQEGLSPRFAPDYLVRAGLIYSAPNECFRLAFTGTMVGESFADDANTLERYVPSYVVWDLTAEAKVYKDIVSINAGVNNLFDEDYYSRVRDDGIDPAAGRNYYVGFSLKF